jgi:hypothetical protein
MMEALTKGNVNGTRMKFDEIFFVEREKILRGDD